MTSRTYITWKVINVINENNACLRDKGFFLQELINTETFTLIANKIKFSLFKCYSNHYQN